VFNKYCNKLDKLNVSAYIIIVMNNISDTLLIRWYIDFCIERNFNQSKMAELMNMSRSWASMLVNDQISSLRFDTRNRIKSILGIQ